MWVDCLCIMQGHTAENQEMISNMHKIYAAASLTIVAAHGVVANAGLLGLTEESRSLEPATFCVNGKPLNVSLDPSPKKLWLGDSAWLHRGWTFQEKALSPRCLMLTRANILGMSTVTMLRRQSERAARKPRSVTNGLRGWIFVPRPFWGISRFKCGSLYRGVH